MSQKPSVVRASLMVGQPNPFDPPQIPPVTVKADAKPNSRVTALLIAAISFVAFALFGFQLLVIFGFSTIVDPSLPDAERRQLAARQFLFGDGPFQIVYVSTFAAITFVAFVSVLAHLSNAVFRYPNLRVAKFVSIGGGMILAAGPIGFYLVRNF